MPLCRIIIGSRLISLYLELRLMHRWAPQADPPLVVPGRKEVLVAVPVPPASPNSGGGAAARMTQGRARRRPEYAYKSDIHRQTLFLVKVALVKVAAFRLTARASPSSFSVAFRVRRQTIVLS